MNNRKSKKKTNTVSCSTQILKIGPDQQYQNNLQVDVYGIFTAGSKPSDSNGRQKRFNRDINLANQIWNGGGMCNINFIPQPIFEVKTIIDVTNLGFQAAMEGPVKDLIKKVKHKIGNPIGIYVVYASGNDFAVSSGSTSPIGAGGVIIEDFRIKDGIPEFKLFGSIALSNRALNAPFTFAHEAGHVLLTELDKQSFNNIFKFNAIDPTGPFINPVTGNSDTAHSNLVGNLMAPILPNIIPTIDPLQLQKARMSRIFQNATITW
ncbi:hypothetical protein BMG_5786 (plasmid) [Priestia megaterium]|uniref:hypothetical protein n=1 Tax=Priestia megaterium TaxID=1404 RepID=UPI0015DC1FCE|nr:hypothetical protein [Priestia megaterium]QLK09038.1 hypothetical protein BMG_5786 [Priestia megaterium]